MRKYIISIFLLIVSTVILAQEQEVAPRLEIEVEDYFQWYTYHKVNDNAFLILSDYTSPEKYCFSIFDKKMEIVKKQEIVFESNSIYLDNYEDEDYLYYLFYRKNAKKLLLSRTSKKSLETNTYHFETKIKGKPLKFAIHNNSMLLGVEVKQSKTNIYNFSLKDYSHNLLFEYDNEKTSSIKYDSIINAYQLVLLTSTNPSINIKTIDTNFNVLNDNYIQRSADRYTYLNSPLENNCDSIVFGSFCNPKLNMFIQKQSEKWIHGFYFGYKEDSNIVINKYYNLTDFRSFDSIIDIIPPYYFYEPRDLYGYNNRLHSVQKNKDEYIVVVESFYPIYQSSNNMDYRYSTTNNVLVGYRTTHVLIAAFDSKGELLWDKTILVDAFSDKNNSPYDNLVYFETDIANSGEIILSYTLNNYVYDFIITSEKEIIRIEDLELKPKYSSDIIKSSISGNFVKWTDNCYLCIGMQTIKNFTNQSNLQKRNVIFVNKLEFE